MTNTHAQSKKRHWRSGSGGALRFVNGSNGVRDHMTLLKYRSGARHAGRFDGPSHTMTLPMDALLGVDLSADAHVLLSLAPPLPPPKPSLVVALPHELLSLIVSHLDGDTLLACALVCRTLAPLTHARDVWRNICVQRWPTLETQFLPQLPGAPDYDLIRLYGGSWRRCFIEQHRKSERAELRVEIPHFAALSAASHPEKIVSETFAIGEHRFCLWVFPSGNPNEPQYAGRVLSVYLVLTDLDQRPLTWLTCAVFSLAVHNHVDPTKRIEWHSCLADNKFDAQLNNWGVHSLGALSTLTHPPNGFVVGANGALTVTARVRLMTITFRIVLDRDLKRHAHLGLAAIADVATLTLPFCCSLFDLLTALERQVQIPSANARVWCFNQPVVSGQALRPRKLLTQTLVDRRQPMFGTLLCDGVDIDAYSCCQLYVEDVGADDTLLEIVDSVVPTTSLDAAMDIEIGAGVDAASNSMAHVFVKLLHPQTQALVFVGRMRFTPQLTPAVVRASAASRLHCAATDLVLYKEEIAPTVFSGPLRASSPLQPADIVILTLASPAAQQAFYAAMAQLLFARYAAAEALLDSPTFAPPTLAAIETLAEQLDIPKFRVRSAFRKCREDGRKTLLYIMEGRHLGFICDSCGETDFKGPRFNCTMCTDYDLCSACNAQCHEVTHRYANVDGKWQRIYNFKDHSVQHAMREMMPVFYQYTRQRICSTSNSNNGTQARAATTTGVFPIVEPRTYVSTSSYVHSSHCA